MTKQSTYNQCLEKMFGLRRFGIKLGLGTIRSILKSLGNPHHNFHCIHVAGTNGKGSVASTLASILIACGYKTGLYTSPHLVNFNERICANNKPISNKNVVESYEAVNRVHHGNREPTFFEFTTAMAFYEFGKQNVDFAVIETGMGGRLDATNIIKPSLSIITNISVEHREYLGNTIAEISGEKGGIIKKNIPVVTGVRQKSAIAVLRKIAGDKSAPFYLLRDAFKVRKNQGGAFTYFGMKHKWPNMKAGLQGKYQIDNLALVLAACEVLENKIPNLSLQKIQKGLSLHKWPGRLEVVSTSPYIMLDGAHNLIAARNLSKFLKTDLADKKITLIVGMLDDKPYTAMLKTLLPVCDKVVLTSPKIDRALPAEKLLPVARKLTPNIQMIPDVEKAIRHAIKNASSDSAICIAGSLYVVGEAKEALAQILPLNR
ncbi:MAG: bifunctional folylpolyglutamate synthase/dihydrofolate synthase [Deltaproteobacteria bacterium]|nr:bifunctional folylpolyglutamate synthase/dihydrofolate synthase [Deltaproteobacteria bacterium]